MFQFNVNTQFIDASEVYGSNESTSLRLRAMEGGRLNFSVIDNGQIFCPFVKDIQKLSVVMPHHIMFDAGWYKRIFQK